MIFRETPLPGAFTIELQPIKDERGSFARFFCEKEFAAAGLEARFPQWSVSRNTKKYTLRGMHYQEEPNAEVKLVRCTKGAVHDVIVDLRKNSPTYCHWFAVELTSANAIGLYVPKGMAHGFQTLSDDTEVTYYISEFHEPAAGRGVRWNDLLFNIQWPKASSIIMSDRDRSYQDFAP